MHLLECTDGDEFVLTKNLTGDNEIPPYAILSHTWTDDDEVTFHDIKNRTGTSKKGYNKIRFCAQQAKRDGLRYFWVDTCCIDKSNQVALQDAINSMFRWYQNAKECYVYLSDVSTNKRKICEESSMHTWETAFRHSRWFSRGWTLQELLAPRLVTFFSCEGNKLGNKITLERQIYEVTGIAIRALQGTPLCEFSVEERFSWTSSRHTTYKEDKAYSLFGMFDICMPLLYGEGEEKAFRRLRAEISKLSYDTAQILEDRECIQYLRLTDPRDDKKRIEDTKGGLIKDSYRWILDHSDFQKWRSDEQSRLLWINGDPGKGKTMLLCGIIDELEKSKDKDNLLSFFFCQATDSRINNSIAVLRGLLYMLVDQQPSLISHIRRKQGHAGKTLFEDVNAWVALTEIFKNILQDPSINNIWLVIDALDECVHDLPRLLQFVTQQAISSRVKWIVSSRNWPDIQEQLERPTQKVKLSLELNADSVSAAVAIFIKNKVSQLAQRKKYDTRTQDTVQDHLTSNANDTFLWVALVCQILEETPKRNVLKKLNIIPPGLDSLYERMMQRIDDSDDAELCTQILASAVSFYRPATIHELAVLVEQLEGTADDLESVREIIGLCGSFLTLRKDIVYFVHQSAKDYLLEKTSEKLFPMGIAETHHKISSRSLKIMSRTLRRDIYGLGQVGFPVDRVQAPDPDPLLAVRYSCVYWVDHLCEWGSYSPMDHKVDLQDGGTVYEFVKLNFLYWLEALSLCRSIPKGVLAMTKLDKLIQVTANS
jgi:hypothetical protein